MKKPYLFDEFFSSNFEESINPFLTKNSRFFAKNLHLRNAFSASLLLLLAFSFSFVNASLSSLLLALVYFLVGTPALIAAIDDIKNLEINIDVLMTVAAFTAILIDSAIEGALLLVLFNLSHAIEHAVSKKTRNAIHSLNTLSPKYASLIDKEGTVFEKSVREVLIGETLFVKNGEIVPLDGTVVKGTSSLNLVHLTGESFPVSKTVGDTVAAGSRNLESALHIKVERTSGDSTLSKIIKLITQAGEAKPRLESFLDRFGKHYATAIIAITFLAALLPPLFFAISYSGIEGSIYRALAFLIAASPCALIIATPTAYLSAISACAKKGILLKGGIILDALASCTIIAFDKTGTLTTGDLSCVGFQALTPSSFSLDKALSIAYGLEQHVVHPIAKAIAKMAQDKKISPAEIKDFRAIPGSGLEGFFENFAVSIGLPEFIAPKLSLSFRENLQEALAMSKARGEIVAVLRIGEEIFLFRFSDSIRKETSKLLSLMKKENRLRSIMLTGDHLENANAVGKELGLDEIFADLRPEDKLEKVSDLTKKANLAMVGDGINDAPALSRATVGISMGKVGSATAVDASDVVLLNDDLHHLPWLFSKAKKTRAIVKQNLALALSVICFATIPALLGGVPLWAAVLLHEGGTLLVGCNSLRLLRS